MIVREKDHFHEFLEMLLDFTRSHATRVDGTISICIYLRRELFLIYTSSTFGKITKRILFHHIFIVKDPFHFENSISI